MPLLDKQLVEYVSSLKHREPLVSQKLTDILHDWAESNTISALLPYDQQKYWRRVESQIAKVYLVGLPLRVSVPAEITSSFATFLERQHYLLYDLRIKETVKFYTRTWVDGIAFQSKSYSRTTIRNSYRVAFRGNQGKEEYGEVVIYGAYEIDAKLAAYAYVKLWAIDHRGWLSETTDNKWVPLAYLNRKVIFFSN
eukprot:TRINITY_DN6452_c0_g2_i1.p1 TRINITY_DN6452_c0_g2~~TRINITY_DN6452_c0_g2_i1.p1  ORF type:complete len:196 (-),score=16.74 TRINITY_DN6452_c0_g2_i1:5-592(-)